MENDEFQSLIPEDLRAHLSVLDERGKQILILRFGFDRGEPRTVEEVAILLGIDAQEVRDIDAAVWARLKEPIFTPPVGARDLHDATLLDFALDWRTSVLQIRLAAATGPVEIVVEGLEAVRLTNLAPWGPSASILEVGLAEGLGDGQRLVIRLQSGDEIEVLARRIQLPDP